MKTKQQKPLPIRWMTRRDMPEVLAIETATDFPWCEEEFITALRQRNCIGMVTESGSRVVGYMIYELHKNRLHILKMAVHPSVMRRGVGTVMVSKLAGKLSMDRRSRIMAEVRETNLDACLFLKAMGFRAISILRDYFDGEDGLLFQYRMPAQ